jgi:hypothetical protein
MGAFYPRPDFYPRPASGGERANPGRRFPHGADKRLFGQLAAQSYVEQANRR